MVGTATTPGFVQTGRKGRRPNPRVAESLDLFDAAKALEARAEAMLRSIPRAAEHLDRPMPAKKRKSLDRAKLLEETVEEVGPIIRNNLDQEDPNGALAVAEGLLRQARETRWKGVSAHDSIATRMARVFKGGGSTVDPDALQVARIGLFEAAKRYDRKKNVQFGTYAAWWVRAWMTRDLATDELSASARELLRNIRKLAKMDITDDKRVADYLGQTVERIRSVRAMAVTQQQVSLDQPLEGGEIPGESSNTLHDMLYEEVDPDREDPLDLERLRKLLDRLPERPRGVLEQRYGLDGEPKTLVEIADRLELSRERVRQLEKEGMLRLRELWEEMPEPSESPYERIIAVVERHPEGISGVDCAHEAAIVYWKAARQIRRAIDEGRILGKGHGRGRLLFPLRTPPPRGRQRSNVERFGQVVHIPIVHPTEGSGQSKQEPAVGQGLSVVVRRVAEQADRLNRVEGDLQELRTALGASGEHVLTISAEIKATQPRLDALDRRVSIAAEGLAGEVQARHLIEARLSEIELLFGEHAAGTHDRFRVMEEALSALAAKVKTLDTTPRVSRRVLTLPLALAIAEGVMPDIPLRQAPPGYWGPERKPADPNERLPSGSLPVGQVTLYVSPNGDLHLDLAEMSEVVSADVSAKEQDPTSRS